MNRFKVTVERTWVEEGTIVVEAANSADAMLLVSAFGCEFTWKPQMRLETGAEPVRVKALKKKDKP